MNDFVLSCCSTADLTKEQLKEYGLEYVCFSFEIDGKRYPDDLGESIQFSEFYQAMRDGAMTKTSQVNVDEYINFFEGFLKKGKDVLHLSLSSGISGSVNSAMIAKGELMERYPDRKLYIVDSLAASGGYGFLMMKLSELRAEGMDIDELHDWVEENKLMVNHWFFTTDLTYLVRGGRVSKTSGFVGNLLNICPLLNVDYQGKLIPRMKVRTKKKVIQETVKKMIEHAEDGIDYSGKCLITMADCYEDAEAVAKLVEDTFPKLNGKVIINYIGTTIGAHTGPGTVALFFWGAKRED